MITTVCLNPAVDQSANVDRLQAGGVNRLRDNRSVIGGKGVNVAIVLGRLRAGVNCLGFIGESDMPFFAQGMKREGVNFQAVSVPGSVRRNLKIFDAVDHSVTEFNERGAEADDVALKQLMEALARQAADSQYIALCGSLPPGCGRDTYQTLMQTMPDKRWVVDASGDALRCALKGKPFLMKPNLAELEEITQTKLTTTEEIKDAAIELCKAGIAYVAVSLGARGALLTDGTRTVFSPAVPVPPASALGAGDAMLAGLLFGLAKGETVFDSLRCGIAAGSACVLGGGIHSFRENEFSAMLSKVAIRTL